MAKLSFQWPSVDPLLPAQERFLSSPKSYRFYVGPWGSGKTQILCEAAVFLSLKYPGNRSILGRYRWRDFEKTTQVTLMKTIPKGMLDTKKTVMSKGLWTFINGSEIFGAHFDDKEQFFSGEIGWFGVDEVTELPDHDVWNTLEGRLRWVLPRCCLHRDQNCPEVIGGTDVVCPGRRPAYYGLGTGNPNGHDWVWAKSHPDSKQRLIDYDLITPAPFENAKNLPEGYYQNLIRRNGDDWVKRFVFGSFDVFESQVWKEWNQKVHLIAPFKIPETWTRGVWLDHGVNAPTAAVWSAIDHDGNFIFYRDYKEVHPAVSVHADRILDESNKEIIDLWEADPAIWQTKGVKHGTLEPYAVYDEYFESGITFSPAQNDLSAGISRVSSYLKPDEDRRFPHWHPKAGEPGAPKMFVFTTCKEIKQDLPAWKYMPIKDGITERPSNKDKHIPDCVRYAIMSREQSLSPNAFKGVEPSTEQLRQRQKFSVQTYPTRHYANLQKAREEQRDKDWMDQEMY
jgi:hypothetical protein